MDKIKNNGAEAVIDHVKSEIKAAEEDALDSFATGLYSAGTSDLEIDGMRVFLSTSNTYGGIDQSANSWAQSNIDSTTTTLSLSALQTQFEAATEGSDKPDLVVMPSTQFSTFWGLLQPQERYTDTNIAKAGFTNLMFNGAMVAEDSYAPYVIGINTKRIKLISSSQRKFPGKFEDFDMPHNQDAMVAHIRWAGNLVCEQPRKFFALSNLT